MEQDCEWHAVADVKESGNQQQAKTVCKARLFFRSYSVNWEYILAKPKVIVKGKTKTAFCEIYFVNTGYE